MRIFWISCKTIIFCFGLPFDKHILNLPTSLSNLWYRQLQSNPVPSQLPTRRVYCHWTQAGYHQVCQPWICSFYTTTEVILTRHQLSLTLLCLKKIPIALTTQNEILTFTGGPFSASRSPKLFISLTIFTLGWCCLLYLQPSLLTCWPGVTVQNHLKKLTFEITVLFLFPLLLSVLLYYLNFCHGTCELLKLSVLFLHLFLIYLPWLNRDFIFQLTAIFQYLELN